MTPQQSNLVTALLAIASTMAASTMAASALAQDTAAAPAPAAPTASPPSAPPLPALPAPAPAADTAASAPAPSAPAPATDAAAADAPPAAAESIPAPTPAAAPAPAAVPNTAAPPAASPIPAPLPYPASPALDDPEEPPSPRDVPLIDAWLGVHVAVISNPRYDVFAEDDALTSFTAGFGLELADLGAARLALVASTALGGTDARVRDRISELTVTRLELGPELRFPVVSGFFAYGRVSPLATHVDAELSDSSSGSVLTQSDWQFGADAALGLALRFAAARPSNLPYALGFHLRAEAGYAALSSSELSLAPTGSGAPIRSEPLAFGDFSLSGFQFRTALAVSY